MLEVRKEKICPGCGQVMQDQDPNLSNYVLSLDLKLCMRCFRWRHYKDLPMLIRPVINVSQPEATEIPEHDEVIVVIDGFMLDETLVPLLDWIKKSQHVSVVATKLDLFPKQVKASQIIDQVNALLDKNNLHVEHVFVTSTQWDSTLKDLRDYVLTKADNTRFLVLGMINAGKSSLLNALMKQPDITTSPFPQTTLSSIENSYEHIKLIDMPGFSNPYHLFYHIDPLLYQKVMPDKAIKPQIFQLKGKQTILIDELLMIHCESEELMSCSVYVSDKLKVQRKKTSETLTSLLACESPRTTVLKPSPDGIDFIMEGIGKVHCVGPITKISVEHHPKITIKKSKGTLLW